MFKWLKLVAEWLIPKKTEILTYNKESFECSLLKLEEVGTSSKPLHRLYIRRTVNSRWVVVATACSLTYRYRYYKSILEDQGGNVLWRVHQGEVLSDKQQN